MYMKTLKELLSGIDPVAELRTMIADGTLSTMEPSIANLAQNIPDGYHHKDNLEHSLRVLQNAIDRETDGMDLILRTAALFHDIGKPATRKFGNRRSVTFDGHEMVGANIVRKVLRNHGYTKSEINEIAILVALHMRSHGFDESNWRSSAVRRLITDAGSSETLARLIIIFYADTTTKSERKMKALHAGVDLLVERINEVISMDERKALRPSWNGKEIMKVLGIPAGPGLGQIMKFLNSDEGIYLSYDDALAEVRKRFDV